ncbi:MAG: guanylate kinase [Deltaproteobacteria bacterium]|nr:guanylate kinase [Deltaproteobacteria bacterium]MBW1922201.1 guanylate kinase [Deltaproteobacteria bacterium]MBW1948655.1 guanylate kinase [Deltaproteobacteria bacterium]MBW2006817.1 guanylate kinase [Deltaproteobacteria bacterium]MBW2347312.1 guanylate kinase [Deltaproteobacteria bacterium]
MSSPGKLFVFSAPSGTGKSTVIRALRQGVPGLCYSVSHTSRPPRKGEREGVDYHFVARSRFLEMIEAGDFVEWARVYDDYYGTSFAGLEALTASGLDVVLDLDPKGAKNLKHYDPTCVLIFLLPPSLETLETRLRGRATDGPRSVEKRLAQARDEISQCRHYDYVIVNDDLDRAVDEARAVIISDRCRVERRETALLRLLG